MSNNAEIHVRKAEAYLQLNLARDIKGNKKGFCKYINPKKKVKNIKAFGAGDLAMQNMEKTEVLNIFFTPVFASKTSLQEYWASETRRKGWSKEDVILAKKGSGQIILKQTGYA